MNKNICVLFAVILIYAAIIIGAASALDTICQGQSVDITDIVRTEIPVSDGYKSRLLSEASEIAGKIPVEPHVKDRSRVQAMVAESALELNLPEQSGQIAGEIVNWRRNFCYGDLAAFYAGRGDKIMARIMLEKAQQPTGESQQWRDEEVRTRIIRAKLLLGDKSDLSDLSEEYRVLLAGLENGGNINSWENCKDWLEKAIATGEFGIIKNSLMTYITFLDNEYGNEPVREEIKAAIYKRWDSMPIIVRNDMLEAMATAAIKAEDHIGADECIKRFQEHIEKYPWNTEEAITLNARVASLRSRAGQRSRATEQTEKAWQKFISDGEEIVNIYRAEVLCELAEAFVCVGDQKQALAIYKRAITESLDNPNSRPRAEDLALICCSMAKNEVEPDAQIWQRIKDIKEGLNNPW